jgi:hypothetical protein
MKKLTRERVVPTISASVSWTPEARSTKIDSSWRETHTEPRLTARMALMNLPQTRLHPHSP